MNTIFDKHSEKFNLNNSLTDSIPILMCVCVCVFLCKCVCVYVQITVCMNMKLYEQSTPTENQSNDTSATDIEYEEVTTNK